jgi:hypothetical protein
LLNYLKNNENLYKIDGILDIDPSEKKIKIPYLFEWYSYLNNSALLSYTPSKSKDFNFLRHPERDTGIFQLYLLHRFGINTGTKYDTKVYYLKKKEFEKRKKFPEFILKNIQHYFKNNYN